MQRDGLIIVPCDFSDTSKMAIEYAMQIAALSEGRVLLLHIVSDKSQIKTADENFKRILENLPNIYKKNLTYGIRVGNIFVEINRTIQEKKARLAVMGTHGIRGSQEFTGSWALKVITNSEVPFLVVQETPQPSEGFEKILFPVDFKLSEEKLEWARHIQKLYLPEFCICPIAYEDDFFREKTEENLLRTEHFFKENKISYTIQCIKEDNISRNVVKLARQKESDLILISTMPSNNIIDLMLGILEQEIITNKYKIPVLVINKLPHQL